MREKLEKEINEKLNNIFRGIEKRIEASVKKHLASPATEPPKAIHERDFEIERKFMLHRFWNIRSDIKTYGWLKGLRVGNKQSDEYHEERIKKLALTNDQILQKAKLIETRRKLGYT